MAFNHKFADVSCDEKNEQQVSRETLM